MKRKQTTILILTAAGAAAGFALRRWQLGQTAGAAVWCLGLLCAALTLLLAAACRGLARREAYTDSFSSGRGALAVSLLSAALVLLSAGLPLARGEALLPPVQYLGVLAALCLGAIALLRCRGVVPPIPVHAVPCLYLVVKLIFEFKRWSVDPAVLDYCFDLFFAISAMCATYHLGLFCFDKGRRRICVFWCLMCVVFAAVALADGGWARCLLLAGMGLWCFENARQLLEDPAEETVSD